MKSTKRSKLVICRTPVVSRLGTPDPPAEQIDGRLMLATAIVNGQSGFFDG